MKRNKIIVLLISFSLLNAKEGYFCMPVADLLPKPLFSRNQNNNYPLNALSPEKGQYSCPRIHQGIFNEKIEIIQIHEDEVQVALSNCFYETALSLEEQRLYWTHKDNILFCDDLEKQSISLNIFPPPICIDQLPINNEEVVTLILPWHSKKTNNTYSVGTRFKRETAYDSGDKYGIVFYHHAHREIVYERVPEDKSLILNDRLSFIDRQKLYVKILKLWASHSNDQRHIPYVWGGMSWVQAYGNNFALKKDHWLGQEISYWIRPEKIHPCAGFDCSGLILRAAQIAGIPYFFKNTTTILHHLTHAHLGDTIQEGDIIWCPGHVMVVSDIKNNKLIEARGYAAADGRVVSASLKQRFKTIETYKELLDACIKQTPLQTNGSMQNRRYKILKFSSVYR